jgi:hypothetical protein
VAFAHELREQVEDAGARRGVEVARGLVRQHESRTMRQRPRDGDPLLLAAG